MRLSGWTGITDNAGRRRLRALSYCKPMCIARAMSLKWIPPSRDPEETTDSIHSSDNAAYGNSDVVCSMYSGTYD